MKYHFIQQLEHSIEFCKYCQEQAFYLINNTIYCCSPKITQCKELKRKNSQGGQQTYLLGKRLSGKLQYTNLPQETKNNMAWSKDKHFWNDPRIKSKIDMEELFTYTEKYVAGNRKAILIEERGYKCENCKLSNWLEKPITLEMDHIDGDNKNNVKNNLRLLCPNCHSQTPTWRKGKNLKKLYISDEKFIEALKSTPTIRQALLKLKLTAKGANYVRAKKLLVTINGTSGQI